MPTTNSLLSPVSKTTVNNNNNSNNKMMKKGREKNTMVHGPIGWVLKSDTLNDCFVFKAPCVCSSLLFLADVWFTLAFACALGPFSVSCENAYRWVSSHNEK